jgi:energy-coupling factor transporter ATP-binding protein EcfA2
MRNRRPTLAAPPPDPFGEHKRAAFRERLQVLGGEFEFATDSRRLHRIVRAAYAGLPAHKVTRAAPRFRVTLVAAPPGRGRGGWHGEPPPVRSLAGAGLLCGLMGSASFVSVAVAERAALLVVSAHDLRYPYHVRYELLEFAVYLLAARALRLVPLHAACVGRAGEGVLLMGPSGSGKSTVVLHCLLAGLDLLAEDSVLVRPQGLRASGVANFLHLRRDTLQFLDRADRAALVRRSSVIRRRSGVEKLEIDLRRPHQRVGAAPLHIRAVVFLSSQAARGRALLAPLERSLMLRRLAGSQRYAARQPGWSAFGARLARLPAYELRRGLHPREAAAAVRALLSEPHGRT